MEKEINWFVHPINNQKRLWKDRRDGPKTVVALFTYGDVKPNTMLCMLRDCQQATAITTQVATYNLLAEKGFLSIDKIDLPTTTWDVIMISPSQDALIERIRSIVACRFLKDFPQAEVLVMIDHDIQWQGARESPEPYEGDLLHIARKCAETKTIVGGNVNKKVKNQGTATCWKREEELPLGAELLTDVHYIGAAFTAYHRDALQKVYDTMEEVFPVDRLIFGTCVAPHPHVEGKKLHLSEDWAFCHRAHELGMESFVSMKPLLTHWGDYPYTVIGESGLATGNTVEEETEIRKMSSINIVMAPEIIFSLLHATRGRPQMAEKTKKLWLEKAKDKKRIEYIYSVDDDDVTTALLDTTNTKCVHGVSRGNVDAYNRAAYASIGKILVQVHDDLIPPDGWDELIINKLPVNKESVLWVSDGLPPEVNHNALTILIGTRAWFKSCGYFWCPDFVSIGCDDHMKAMAQRYNAIIDGRKIQFTHLWAGPDRDETQKRSYKKENWVICERAFKMHQRADFPKEPELWPSP